MPKGEVPAREVTCRACGRDFVSTKPGKASWYCHQEDCTRPARPQRSSSRRRGPSITPEQRARVRRQKEIARRVAALHARIARREAAEQRVRDREDAKVANMWLRGLKKIRRKKERERELEQARQERAAQREHDKRERERLKELDKQIRANQRAAAKRRREHEREMEKVRARQEREQAAVMARRRKAIEARMRKKGLEVFGPIMDDDRQMVLLDQLLVIAQKAADIEEVSLAELKKRIVWLAHAKGADDRSRTAQDLAAMALRIADFAAPANEVRLSSVQDDAVAA